jgi:hypothetical protein
MLFGGNGIHVDKTHMPLQHRAHGLQKKKQILQMASVKLLQTNSHIAAKGGHTPVTLS